MLMRKSGILWGVIIILAGVFIGLRSFGLLEIDIFFDGWWSLFLIIPAAVGLFTERNKFGNAVCLLIGIALLLAAQGVIDFELLGKLAIPAIALLVGGKLIYSSVRARDGEKIYEEASKNGEIPYATGAFSASEINFDGEVFRGCELTATFGAVKCDLSRAVIEESSAIKATALFGGIEITVPAGANVKVASNSLFGGVSNEAVAAKDPTLPTIHINALCMFGGVEIK